MLGHDSMKKYGNIFGTTERSTNRIILYLVEKRDEATLLLIIQGQPSSVMDEGAYTKLNQHSYRRTMIKEHL